MSIELIEKLMVERAKTTTVCGHDNFIYYTAKDVEEMLCLIEASGYQRAEMDIFKGVCNICGGTGQIDRWNSFTNKIENPPFDKMCCWKCCGDGKLPAKCDRD